jgi:multidrug efflux system membrane fusion protein
MLYEVNTVRLLVTSLDVLLLCGVIDPIIIRARRIPLRLIGDLAFQALRHSGEHRLSNKHLFAGVIALAMVVWIFSGELGSNVVTADEADPAVQANQVRTVRGIESVAMARQQVLAVRGQTQVNRMVRVKSEVPGRIEALPAVKGSRVKAGDMLCQIAVDTRQSEVDEARALLTSARLEYDGVLDLKSRGLQSEINVARVYAALETAKARAQQAQLTLQKTRILAPFDGVVDVQPVEIGDYLKVGDVCVGLMEVDPMLVVGQISEKNIGEVALGDQVVGTLLTGQDFVGEVSFIGRAPDAATRTFPIEVTVRGPEMRAGMTAEMNVPTGLETAHLISPGSLVLNDAGSVGVRIVDGESIVRFYEVEIVSEESDGIWVKGLPAQIRLITVGQEEVFDGQLVNIDVSPLAAMVKS